MGTLTQDWKSVMGETQREFEHPHREAAFFYGLFLRGHSVDELRRDIDVPPDILQRWTRMADQEPWYRDSLDRMLAYRKHVLAIFDSLVLSELYLSRQPQ